MSLDATENISTLTPWAALEPSWVILECMPDNDDEDGSLSLYSSFLYLWPTLRSDHLVVAFFSVLFFSTPGHGPLGLKKGDYSNLSLSFILLFCLQK